LKIGLDPNSAPELRREKATMMLLEFLVGTGRCDENGY